MKPYSMDFRRRVAALRQQGQSTSEVAKTMGCSRSWVRRLLQNQRQHGTLEPKKPQRPTQRLYTEQDEQAIRELIARKPDATLAEVAQALGKPASPCTVSRTLARLDLPRKKSPPTPPSRTGRMSKRPGRCGTSSWPRCG
jgi:transposase